MDKRRKWSRISAFGVWHGFNEFPFVETMPLAIGLVCCGVLLWQDLRGRWVGMLPLGGLAVAGLLWGQLAAPPLYWEGVAFNWGAISAILLVLWGYLRLRGMGFVDRSLGLGDVLFFYAAAVWWDPLGFLVYFTGSMVLILGFVLVKRGLGKAESAKAGEVGFAGGIPLAGLMAGLGPLMWGLWKWWLSFN